MKDNMKAALGASLLTTLVFVVIFLALCAPVAFIWSLNVLFGLGIDINVETWFASLVIMLVLASRHPSVKS